MKVETCQIKTLPVRPQVKTTTSKKVNFSLFLRSCLCSRVFSVLPGPSLRDRFSLEHVWHDCQGLRLPLSWAQGVQEDQDPQHQEQPYGRRQVLRHLRRAQIQQQTRQEYF